MPAYRTRDEWLARAAELRIHILVSAGLYPEPEKCDLNPVIFGRVEHENYSVEKVHFESYPGFLVTGNLYRPTGKRGKSPGVLCPHGHSHQGRLEDNEVCSEPKRCIALAQQGYVVFSYDMVGFADSRQVSHQFADTDSVRCLWGVSLMGLQLWNSIRSVDFLCALPDVHATRIGCTGASGGGTQTFMLMAVDRRVAVAAPVVMVSAHFQGGCLCENAPSLRIGTFNVEIAAMMAPRPLLLVGATGDWTKNTLAEEFPAIRRVYKLFDAQDKLSAKLIDAPHNYNRHSREAVYAWFAKHLRGGEGKRAPKESLCAIDKLPDLLVFYGYEHPHAGVNENTLTSHLLSESKRLWQSGLPTNPRSLNQFRKTARPWMRDVLSIDVPCASNLTVDVEERHSIAGQEVQRFCLGRRGDDWRIPASLRWVDGRMSGKQVREAVLIVHPNGRAAVDGIEGSPPNPFAGRMALKGRLIMSMDCSQTGEAIAERDESVRFFATYNRTVTSWRVQDIVDALSYLESREDVNRVSLVGVGEAGLWALLAGALAPSVIRCVIDVAKFADTDDAYAKRLFVPGLRKAGGTRTAAILHAPRPVYLHNTGTDLDMDCVVRVYEASVTEGPLNMQTSKATAAQIVEWLLER